MVKPFQNASIQSDTFFSIYQSEQAIELRRGCEDFEHLRLISSCTSYAQACDLADQLAQAKQLEVQDFISQERTYLTA